MINNSTMKCCICDNKNAGEFITIKDKKYHLCCIEYLQQKVEKTIENLENSIESINNKLADKEIRVENGRIVNPINDYRIVRLKGIRTKCKEILGMLKEEESV